MALVSRLFLHRHSKNSSKQDIYTVDGDNGEPYQLPRRSSSWKQLFTPKQRDGNSRWAPTLSGIVKAGDEGLWSSALFTNPHGHPGEVSFEAICEMFANELRSRSMTERSAYSGEIGKFLNSAKRGATGPRRVQSMSYKKTNSGRKEVAPPTRKSLDMSTVERGLGRSLSIKRPAPVLVPMGNGLVEQDSTSAAQRAWMKKGRPAEYYDGRMSVRLTSAEFAALSVILGSSITSTSSNTEANAVFVDRGAFGISIWSTFTDDGRPKISLKQHKRNISQLPSSGSGHSSLFAKHLACGSLPFSQDAKSISSILVTDETFDAVQLGAPLTMRKRSQQTPQAKFLATLPSSRDLIFYAIEASTKSSPSTPLIDAIALLPFSGGLTPLASAPLIETIQFVASGGLHPGRLLQRVEGLIDKVQRHSPNLNIFGPLHEPQNAGLLFRERERLGKVATGAVTEELADKVARVQRYVALLERLMVLVPDMKPQEVLAAVQEATKKELQRSYIDAVAAHASTPGSASPSSLPTIVDTHCPKSDARSNRRHASNSSRPSARRSPRSSLDSASNGTITSNPGRRSMTFPEHNLGKQVETLLKSDLSFSVDTIAAVARLVIVAWTLSVETVAWEEGEEGFRVPRLEEVPGEMILV
ncbi:hypothetical protein BU25DRAFT_380369 [Macroventuria anomochaeta]|uniref:Uncharacterized protein n=1 Tax=Macroventuria anomochaeta TaxID=301207 RepID=A0ACB6SFZ2_9PLEO|nr:uncharacterized protein BU25DRAFT_380369 [Macroventuria anomochaeta]KAF2633200.1 hypothetical protein BU25DRAFT_380369 [Macroventuria anomochaeta]